MCWVQVAHVAFTQVCRALFRSGATAPEEVEEYKTFGFMMMSELSMMLSWAEQFMGSSSGFVLPAESRRCHQFTDAERSGNRAFVVICTQFT